LLFYHGIDSYDGQGSRIRAFFHWASDPEFIDNAGWDPDSLVLDFGHGYVKYNPVASIDAIAHEYGHGMTQSFIGWLYDPYLSLDQISFHEGLSDIWAAILEYRINNSHDIWKLGEQVINSSYGNCMRNFADPSNSQAEFKMVDYYGTEDYYKGDGYVRSGVFSHWFYHLVNGGSGMSGIGIDDAEIIIADAEFNGYLQFTYDYSDIRQAMLDAAEYESGYSSCSNVYKQIQNAWYLVGVGGYAPSYGVSISGDNTLTLDTQEGHWSAQPWGGCNGNYTFEWYINDDIYPVGTGSTFEATFDDEYYEPEEIIDLVCHVYDGECYEESNSFEVLLEAHEPLAVEDIYGDEDVCLDGWGFWGTQVSGGVGDYVFEWSINDEPISNGYDLGNWFYYPEWHTSFGNTIDFRVYDDETYIDANTFYFDLDWCLLRKGDSLKIYPNPANSYVDISIIETSALDFGSPLSRNGLILDKTIKDANGDYVISIIDNTGRSIFKTKTTQNFIRINTSSYLQGIYQLRVLSSKGITNKQLIITH
jgi:hypothetical protein